MIRNALGVVFIMIGCLAYGAVFLDDSEARIAASQLNVHKPIIPEFEVMLDEPATASPVVRVPEDKGAHPGGYMAAALLPNAVTEATPLPPEDVARVDEVELLVTGPAINKQGEIIPNRIATYRAIAQRGITNEHLQSSLAYIEDRRVDTIEELNRDLAIAFERAFSDRHQAVSNYADWFFGWGQSFQFLVKAMQGAADGALSLDHEKIIALAKVEAEDYMLQHYKELVLQPEIRDPAIVREIEDAIRQAHQDYLAIFHNVDERLTTFVFANARYIEPVEPRRVLAVQLDWDAAKWKDRDGYSEDAVFAGIGSLSLIIGGQLMAPAIEQAVVAFLAPVIAEMVVTLEFAGLGFLAGTEVPLLGNAIGLAVGLSADYLFKVFREAMTREQFEAQALSAVESSMREWQGELQPKVQQIVDQWFSETIALMASQDLKANLEK